MPRSSSSRRRNKWQQDPRDISESLGGLRRTHDLPDGQWSVQRVAGTATGKVYVCPGCGREVPSGQPHVVAWRETAAFGIEVGVDSRRHWHSRCFERFR
ncbi:hypothetical protein DFO66_103303 [Brevibacterium sanguinis]|uniref:ATP/GTP-binding protein n=2 Tax=Brevibacterium TaxID=1696 RepID=A0A366ILA8_9MICO|nr:MULTISPECIES: hypothetical protein [Brevibacterium]RBP66357.1 hypothetical protein DFO66_103303 [Brevibacterium sanguinis]RBP73008.1 hypothetical protein DFO65_103302 [Brevibacterium celere]